MIQVRLLGGTCKALFFFLPFSQNEFDAEFVLRLNTLCLALVVNGPGSIHGRDLEALFLMPQIFLLIQSNFKMFCLYKAFGQTNHEVLLRLNDVCMALVASNSGSIPVRGLFNIILEKKWKNKTIFHLAVSRMPSKHLTTEPPELHSS